MPLSSNLCFAKEPRSLHHLHLTFLPNAATLSHALAPQHALSACQLNHTRKKERLVSSETRWEDWQLWGCLGVWVPTGEHGIIFNKNNLVPLKHALSLSLSLIPPPFPATANLCLYGLEPAVHASYLHTACMHRQSSVYSALSVNFLGCYGAGTVVLLQQGSSLTPSGLQASARRREWDGFVALFVSGETCNCKGGGGVGLC